MWRQRTIRWAVGLLIVLPATVFLGPIALFGMLVFFDRASLRFSESFSEVDWIFLVAAVGGLSGLLTVWLILLVPRRYFHQRVLLRGVCTTGLLLGLVSALVLIYAVILDGNGEAPSFIWIGLISFLALIGACLIYQLNVKRSYFNRLM
jgi:hypothetical protein